MNHLVKVLGMTALGGALASAHAAYTANHSLTEIGLAALGGAVAAVIALYIPAPGRR